MGVEKCDGFDLVETLLAHRRLDEMEGVDVLAFFDDVVAKGVEGAKFEQCGIGGDVVTVIGGGLNTSSQMM